jgi:hypothetical protein
MITIPLWEYRLLYFIALIQCLAFIDRILNLQ